mgnify:CR=1 FL=1
MKLSDYLKYDVSKHKQKCPVCGKIAKNNKCLIDHIFHRNLKDQEHKGLAQKTREEFNQMLLKKAKHICQVCNKPILRSLATHFRCSIDKNHQIFLQKQVELAVRLLNEGKTLTDIENDSLIFMNGKWILRSIYSKIGKVKADEIIYRNFSKKRKEIWAGRTEEERKEIMQKVRVAEWGHLSPEQRKRHPWVIAGRLGSLKSSNRGSRNQQYAFELLQKKLDYIDWIYNHAINENWQIDIAAPEKSIFIEWDGRHHRIPIHGQGYLNNRQNRDKQKDKIIVRELKGTLIRVEDNGRFDPVFVDEITDEIIDLVESEKLKKGVYFLK